MRWRRKIQLGGDWWAQARDGSWVRWDALRSDWVRQAGGPPEPVPALAPEGGEVYAPPPRDTLEPASLGWDFTKTFAAIGVPAVIAMGAAALAVGAVSLIWNMLFVPWMGDPVHPGTLLVVMISASLAVAFFLSIAITIVRAFGTVAALLVATAIVASGTFATLYLVARSRGLGVLDLMSRRETVAAGLIIAVAWGGLSLRRWARSD